MPNADISTQISIVDDLSRRYDDVISQWGEWRDAQGLDDTSKELVDLVFTQQLATLEKLLLHMGCDILPY